MLKRDSAFDLGRAFCDVVMKGGITSGVVYPKAITRLAAVYKLRSIGGASAGAIAAAAAAAAEYRRQTRLGKPDADAGFTELDTLPDKLGTDVDGKHTFLFYLFRPSTISQPLFGLLTSMLNLETQKGRLAAGALGLVRYFPLAALSGAALGMLLVVPAVQKLRATFAPAYDCFAGQPVCIAASSAGVVLAVLALLVLAVGLAALAAFNRLGKAMQAQNFGLCTGMREAQDNTANGQPSLTEWLHRDLIQHTAGLDPARPLTFGDLKAVKFQDDPECQIGINLKLMTTCLTAGRPYTLPFGPSDTFYFDPDEMRGYFPAAVVDWLVAEGGPPRKALDEEADGVGDDEEEQPRKKSAHPVSDCLTAFEAETGRKIVRLPDADNLPVILGVRMSLSFPILLSAIGLYRIARRKERTQEGSNDYHWALYVGRVYFTDGGVCSNMPVHMFDAPLPMWPTFAINLRDDLPEQHKDQFDTERIVFRPRGGELRGDRYAIEGDTGLAETISFLGTIVKTMQNWRDMLQREAPGTKDRVVTVRHTAKEGGLNLDMKKAAITTLSDSGQAAAGELAKAFVPPVDTPYDDDSWAHQRWVRLRMFLPQFEAMIGKIDKNITSSKLTPTTRDLLNDPKSYVGESHRLDMPGRAAANQLLDDIEETKKHLDVPHDFEKNAPRPRGDFSAPPPF